MTEGGVGVDGLFPARAGERLAAERARQKLSIEDVSERTRIRPRHLIAIEGGDHADLPAITYSAGFVKTYARLLGMDAEALARDFRAEMGRGEPARDYTAPFEPADPKRVPSRALALIGLGVAILLAVSYLVWRGGGGDERARLAAGTTPPSETNLTTPAPTTAAVALPTPAAVAPAPGSAEGPVAVSAVGPVWLKIYAGNDQTLYMGEMKAGDRFEVPAAAADPQIWTGRPDAIKVTVGTVAIPQLAPAEQTIRDVSLRRDALLARLPTPPAPPPKPRQPPPPSVTPVDPQAP